MRAEKKSAEVSSIYLTLEWQSGHLKRIFISEMKGNARTGIRFISRAWMSSIRRQVFRQVIHVAGKTFG